MTITRFAPSPTGPMHVGNARTAIFNYLFAKKHGGNFYLRIEDTDRERFNPESEQEILENLDWLGIKYDKFGDFATDYFVQSKRVEIYQAYAEELVEKGFAYKCYCTKERLDDLRKEQEKTGKPTCYDKHCLDHAPDDPQAPYVIRLKVPEGKTIEFEDLVRGHVSFSSNDLDDSILLKSDGFPTYHLASAVDDHAMKVSHILRSEEWLPSTPKHILIHEAFGWEAPQFGHLSLILGKDRSKLSKRHGATSVKDFRNQGYLPEAILNYIVLLGWNPKTEEEFFTLQDLETRFDIEGVNKSGAVFDQDRLNYFNRHYIATCANDRLYDLIKDYPCIKDKAKENVIKAIDLVKPRMDRLNQFDELTGFLFNKPEIQVDDLIFKKSTRQSALKGLEIAEKEMAKSESLDPEELKKAFEKAVERNMITNGDLFWTLRYALTGEKKSPPPEQIIAIIGREDAFSRIEKAKELLK